MKMGRHRGVNGVRQDSVLDDLNILVRSFLPACISYHLTVIYCRSSQFNAKSLQQRRQCLQPFEDD